MATTMFPISSRLLERRRGKGIDLNVDCEAVAARQKIENLLEIDEVSKSYDSLEVLGQGSLSVVYRGVQRATGEKVALKVVRTRDEEVVQTCREEFLLLQKINHPNIVRVIDFFVTRHRTVMAMTFFDGTALGSVMRRLKTQQLPEVTAHNLFTALLEALDHLHQHRTVHRDVKPENVLVSHDLTSLQLVDFNIARYLPEGGALSPNCTPAYAAPEVRKGGSPSEASDVWGAGLCLCMMLTGQCKCNDRYDVCLSQCVVSDACMTTLKQCLTIDDTMRPAAMTLLQSPWVQFGPAADDKPLQSSPMRQRSTSPSNSQGSGWRSSTPRSRWNCKGGPRSHSCDSSPSTSRSHSRSSRSPLLPEVLEPTTGPTMDLNWKSVLSQSLHGTPHCESGIEASTYQRPSEDLLSPAQIKLVVKLQEAKQSVGAKKAELPPKDDVPKFVSPARARVLTAAQRAAKVKRFQNISSLFENGV